MNAPLGILWRGSLSSCNYGCGYCPFAKTNDSKEALAADRMALERFCKWVSQRSAAVSVLITPWGEGLIRNYYRTAIMELSWLQNVSTIAIQTNMSCSVDWIAQCDPASTAFWITYHPEEVDRAKFVNKIHRLEAMNIRYSVGVVGLPEHIDEIEVLRKELPATCYVWVNAYRAPRHRYTADDTHRLSAIDPLFTLNNRIYRTRGRRCSSGESTISVDADGTAYRCHFIKKPIGNIYDPAFDAALRPRLCQANSCHCHIGYSHLEDLGLKQLFGRGFWERRPDNDVTIADAQACLASFTRSAARSR